MYTEEEKKVVRKVLKEIWTMGGVYETMDTRSAIKEMARRYNL